MLRRRLFGRQDRSFVSSQKEEGSEDRARTDGGTKERRLMCDMLLVWMVEEERWKERKRDRDISSKNGEETHALTSFRPFSLLSSSSHKSH